MLKGERKRTKDGQDSGRRFKKKKAKKGVIAMTIVMGKKSPEQMQTGVVCT